MFEDAWYPKVLKLIDEHMDDKCFGPQLVADFVAEVYAAETESPLNEAWVPSERWCYWFMRTQAKLVVRRFTGFRASPEAAATQLRLHGLNLNRLALALDDGWLTEKYILGADEVGIHHFPQLSHKWARLGATAVMRADKDDKRQFTADIANNAAGEVISVHVIFQGKTAQVLPPPATRAEMPLVHFAHTANHWCDHKTKVAWVQHLWAWVVKEWAKDKGLSLEAASKSARALLLLDCWPVNLTALFRTTIAATCPGLDIMFIPAGYTGSVQVRVCVGTQTWGSGSGSWWH